MPIHNWACVDTNLFHDFHQSWTVALCRALNEGGLPSHYSALLAAYDPGSTAHAKDQILAARGNRITIRRPLRTIRSIIEIVSPGCKTNPEALRSFVDKMLRLLRQGVHVLVVDLFPPSARDPQGIHKAIWDEIEDQPFVLPPDKPLTLAAYVATVPKTAYVQRVGVGDPLPDMPAYLDVDHWVPVRLEATYQSTWASCPEDMREAVEKGVRFLDEPSE